MRPSSTAAASKMTRVLAHHGMVLVLCYRINAQVERLRDPHAVDRFFVVGLVASHLELARGNEDHFFRLMPPRRSAVIFFSRVGLVAVTCCRSAATLSIVLQPGQGNSLPAALGFSRSTFPQVGQGSRAASSIASATTPRGGGEGRQP